MAAESPGRSRSRKRIAVAITLALAGVAVVGLGAFYASSFYGTYICRYCGLKRTVDSRSIAGVTYYQRVTLSDTAISRPFNSPRKQKCRHEWDLIRWGRGSWREAADGGTRCHVLRMLIRDDAFARELAAMPHARQVWHAIMIAGDKSPRQADALVGDWWLAGPDHEPFARWWATNEKRVNQLASGSRQRE